MSKYKESGLDINKGISIKMLNQVIHTYDFLFSVVSGTTSSISQIQVENAIFFDIIEIYNRWGQMVFKSTNLDNQWDGKFQQINSPPGTYVYKIKTTDFGTELKLIKSGTVSLVR